MILHSIIPPEAVMSVDEPIEYETRKMPSGYVQGVNTNGKFTVCRLISTDPSLYLDPKYAPGSILE